MTLDSSHMIGSRLVDRLLALPTFEQQAAFLEAEGLLNPDGLDRMLDVADRLVNNDPGKARRLAGLCASMAERAEAPAAEPRANYVLAGTLDVNGEFDAELRLNKVAHDGYVALKKSLEALRTTARAETRRSPAAAATTRSMATPPTLPLSRATTPSTSRTETLGTPSTVAPTQPS